MAMLKREHVDGAVRGALGSVAGLAAMGLCFWAARGLSGGGGDGEADVLERRDDLDDISVVGDQREGDEPATEAMGRIAYEAATGNDPNEAVKQRLGDAVHWGYGILMGGVYGALRSDARTPDLAAGLGYGTALWVLGDEIMVPLLGLSDGPTAHSVPEHATALGAHLAYGAATATATQALKRVM